MQTLEVTKSNAIKAFDVADENGKTLLANLFGEATFSRKITDRVKTFKNACDLVDVDPHADRFSSHESTLDEIAYMKLKVIVAALNEDWAPDWSDNNQQKWAPWFYMNEPGFRFLASAYVYALTYSAGSSRLCFKSQELANYAGQQFLDIYRDFFTNQ